MPLKSDAGGLLWPHRQVVLLLAVCVLVASACSADGNSPASILGSAKESLGQEPPPDAEDLRDLAERYRLDDPPEDVAFERYISPEEYATVMVPCLTEQGIPVRALADGGIAFDDIPPEQALLQAEAMYRCDVRFPTHPLFAEPLDDEQLRRLYGYLVGDLTACLEAEGYASSPPPTVETFIASYSDPNAEVWTPYPVDDPRLQQPEEWDRLNEICPQAPPLEVLYGASVSFDGN